MLCRYISSVPCNMKRRAQEIDRMYSTSRIGISYCGVCGLVVGVSAEQRAKHDRALRPAI